MKHPDAKQAVLDLVREADVFVQNNRPQVMTKLGLDYAALRAANPRIIYCGSYGYSRKGPYGSKGALDDSIQSISGIAMLNKLVLGEPRYLPTVVADKTTAITVVYAVLAALFSRERTGQGQEIEVPMFETMVSFVMAEHLWSMAFEPPLRPPGYVRLMSVHRRPYKTRDGYVAILPYMNAHWDTFCEVVGRKDLLEDPRFRTIPPMSAMAALNIFYCRSNNHMPIRERGCQFFDTPGLHQQSEQRLASGGRSWSPSNPASCSGRFLMIL